MEFCASHSSETAQIRYEYEFRDHAAILIERRPAFMNASEWTTRPIAKFRYAAAKRIWTLYWSDTRDHWKRVAGTKPAAEVRTLLDAVLSDSSGVFWG